MPITPHFRRLPSVTITGTVWNKAAANSADFSPWGNRNNSSNATKISRKLEILNQSINVVAIRTQ